MSDDQVKRYQLDYHHTQTYAEMVEDCDGDWVKYNDYKAASDRIEELEAKLTNQTHMIAQVFALLDVTEETEDGRVFHPTQIRSSRVLDAEKLGALLAELRDTLTANNKENSYAE
jgi:hypothetical protein